MDMKRILLAISIWSTISLAAFGQDETFKIQIPNMHKQAQMKPMTSYNGGPCVGEILNAHYFPGMLEYLDGNFAFAVQQMDYFIARPQYTVMNPKQAEYFSIAHYIRGTIYLYHAEGTGRLALAVEDLEKSIQWNPRNYFARLEIARAYEITGLKGQAIGTLERLLESKPGDSIAEEATQELKALQSGTAVKK